MKFALALILLIAGFSASAESPARTVTVLDENAFNALNANPAVLNPSTLYYTQRVLPFTEWTKMFPAEAQALDLYPNFVEPTVTAVKNGISSQVVEKMMMFIVRAKVVLNKAPGQIGLINFTKLDSIKKFDPELKQVQIQPNQFMSTVAGKGQIANFEWCAKDSFLKPKREKDLSYLVPKGRANWCADTARSICVETCYLFNGGYSDAISLANLTKNEDEKKDFGIGFQSEIRYFANQQESGSQVNLATLTGIPTAVRGGLEQNSFYFNQIFQYAKILGVMQDHPDPSKTLATVYFVVALKKRTWDSNSLIPQVLLGQSKRLNTASGITAGLPVFTQTTLKSIVTILEN